MGVKRSKLFARGGRFPSALPALQFSRALYLRIGAAAIW